MLLPARLRGLRARWAETALEKSWWRASKSPCARSWSTGAEKRARLRAGRRRAARPCAKPRSDRAWPAQRDSAQCRALGLHSARSTVPRSRRAIRAGSAAL